MAREYATLGGIFKCFYDTTDTSKVIIDKIDMNDLLHSMFWSSLFCAIGLLMLLSSIFVERRLKREEKRFDAIKKKLIEAHQFANATNEDPARKLSKVSIAHGETKSSRKTSVEGRLEARGHRHNKQRRVSILSLPNQAPKGGQPNLAFVVTDRSGPPTPRPGRSPRTSKPIVSLDSFKSTDSAKSEDSKSHQNNFSLHRGQSFDSLDSSRSQGIYPSNFNPPGIMKTRASQETAGSRSSSTGSAASSSAAYLTVNVLDDNASSTPNRGKEVATKKKEVDKVIEVVHF